MINGSFGAGKTTAANNLNSILPNSMIFDPEEVGCMLRKTVAKEVWEDLERTDDFQDLDLWKILVVNVGREIKNKYKRNLIVPMTLYKLNNFEYIVNGFKSFDNEVNHFCLVASEDIIHERLKLRGDQVGGWSFQQAAKCMKAFGDNRFKEHINTDHLDSTGVINEILEKINLKVARRSD